MSETLMEGVEVDQPVGPRNLLTTALPAPAGWTQGLSIPFYGCGEPLLQNRCVTANDEPKRESVAEFYPFGINQGATCSTLGRSDQKAHASGRLDATTEWAVARQLATDGLGLDTPSFADGTSLGTVADADFTLALGVLEQAASDAGYGSVWWIHSSVLGASYLANAGLVSDNRTASDAPVIVSPGYPVPDATTVRLWATGPVWVGLGDSFVLNDVDWRTNDANAYANRDALVAFDPCVNLYIDVTIPAVS